MRQWRLLNDTPAAGAYNMAADEAIFTAVSAGVSLPTLRLYGWQPLCLSLGYGQRSADVDLERIQANGWGIVRRPTGGRAILHGDELTYSVSLPAEDDLAQGDVVESYRRISQALLKALQFLGLSPQSEKQVQGNRSLGPVCFEVPSHYEITANGKKLIGSAQVRRKTGILQHGTLPLYGDIGRICDVLVYENDEAREIARQQVCERATTLETVAGKVIDWHTAADALVRGFAETFDIDFIPDRLSSDEKQCAESLTHTTYANDRWTFKR